MLINIKKDAIDMIFFHQNMRNWYLGNYKKEGIFLPVWTGGAKNEIKGPSGPPLYT